MRVHGVRKVVINGGGPFQVPLRRHEHLQDEVLHVVDTARVTGELGIIELNVRRRILHLQREQVRLVQEQDDGDVLERRIVHDRVEDVPRLLQSIRALVLGQHLVELGRRHEEEDRGDGTVEALCPLLSLRSLSTHVHEDKRNVLDANGELVHALGRLPAVQDVLVRRHVLRPRYPVQFVQEITNRVTLRGRGGRRRREISDVFI